MRARRLLIACVAVACSRAPLFESPFRGADVILVSIDSLRADHLGAYGYPRPTSPTIDGLASRGIRFENAVSTTSWTLPAHAALFTGLSDLAHGVFSGTQRLGPEHVTLAEALAEGGYHTAGFFGGPYLHSSFGLDQGFATWQSCMTTLSDTTPEASVRAAAKGGADTAHVDVTGPRTLREVETWVAEQLDARPFFLFLHLWDVHYEYIPPRHHLELFDPEAADLPPLSFHDPAVRDGMPPREFARWVSQYDGEIRFADEILGRILEGIDRRGRLEKAVVVVTADHGEEFFEHGGKGHRRTLYDEVLRVPLVVRLPGGAAGGRVVRDQVSLVDVLPTLLALVGLAPPGPVEGRDLSPLLRGETLPEAPLLAALQRRGERLRAVRTNRAKFVTHGNGVDDFYDLTRDPGERFPLGPDAEGRAEAAERLRALTRAATALHARLVRNEAARSELDAEVRRRLEALGYLGTHEPRPGTD